MGLRIYNPMPGLRHRARFHVPSRCSVQGECRQGVVVTWLLALKEDPPSRGDKVQQCWLRTPDGPQPRYSYRKVDYRSL